jgi:hypothetical protein
MARALLHLLGSCAHSPSVRLSFPPGQHTKLAINAAIAASSANRGSGKERRMRRKRVHAIDMREGMWEGEHKTFKEEMDAHIQMIRDFADGLEYQVSFQDRRFLKTLQKEGVGFFRLAENCPSRERRFNSSREASPTTWESSTANAMFYRARPRRDQM